MKWYWKYITTFQRIFGRRCRSQGIRHAWISNKCPFKQGWVSVLDNQESVEYSNRTPWARQDDHACSDVTEELFVFWCVSSHWSFFPSLSSLWWLISLHFLIIMTPRTWLNWNVTERAVQYLLVHIIIMQSIHSRVFGIVCRYPSCNRPFPSMNAYHWYASLVPWRMWHQHRHGRHPSDNGTSLCANITYMHEIDVERRANVATAILRREHEPGKVHVYLVIIPIISWK